jgi:hypothetical protein
MAGHTITGKLVRAFDLAPLANQTVRFITQAGYLQNAANRTLLPAGQVDWTRSLCDFSGTRWECWEQQLNGKVGISWGDFRDNALIYNPHLSEDGRIYQPEKSYLLPEVSSGQEVAWSRVLTGFAGSRWDCWEQQIKGKVPITWEEFRDNALVHNPQLSADGRLFQAGKSYMLPDVISTARAYVETTSDANGNYRFEGIAPGAGGILEVSAAGYTPVRQPVVVNGDINQPITVKGGGSGVRSALPNYGALHPKVRAIIDQALGLLGDERSVYDSLPANLQQMCYGAQFINDPNNQYYKDIVCADLVSISLAAAGFNVNWSSGANPHMAQHYAPGPDALSEITDDNDWQPGDVMVYGNHGAARAGHVTLYVGPFQGTDRSGKTYSLSGNNDVVEASMNFDLSNGQRWGLGNIATTRKQCKDGKRGYQWIKRVRLKEVAALL